MRILVTGASGLLGLNFSMQTASEHTVLAVVNRHGLNASAFDTYSVDLLTKDAIPQLIDQTEPDWILHCAAIASIDHSDDQGELSQKLNAEVPGIFSLEAKKRNIRLLHISTDAVFDGISGNHSEQDPTNPLSIYAQTKLAGERAVTDANSDALIARVVFYGWSLFGNRSLSEFFINNLMKGNQVKGFTNLQFSPLQVNDLSEILLEMMNKNLSGIYHAVSSESLSKYEFGVRLAEKFGLDAGLISPVENTRENRSPNLTLNTDKLTKDLGHSMPTIQTGIERLFEQFNTSYLDKIERMQVLV